MTLLRRRLVFTGSVVAGAAIFWWVLESDSSPLRDYFLWHVSLPNAWGRLNLPAALVGFAVSGNVHQLSLAGFIVGMIVQWGLTAYLLSLLLIRDRRLR